MRTLVRAGVPICVILFSLGLGACTAIAKDNANQGGGPHMAEPTLIHIQPREQDPFPPAIQQAPIPRQFPERRLIPLDDLKSKAGSFFVPTYLPKGLKLDESFISFGRIVHLNYKGDGVRLMISQDTLPAYPRPKPGYYRPVSVGPYPGYLIRGAWTRFFHPGSNSPTPTRWEPNMALKLIFQRDGTVITLIVFKGDALPESELIKIAEFLQPY